MTIRGEGELRSSEKIVLMVMACALACVVLSILFGALGALYYVPEVSARMSCHFSSKAMSLSL